MLSRRTIFMNDRDMKKLDEIGKVRGLKPAQLVRIAVSDWLRREAHQQAAIPKRQPRAREAQEIPF
jgi:hypothetical protein